MSNTSVIDENIRNKLVVIAPGFSPAPEVTSFLNSHFGQDVWVKSRSNGHYLFSQTQSYRAKDLISAFNDDRIKYIWCVRGGYGSLDLLSSLAKIKRPAVPKLLIGLSDVTSLHLFLNTQWGWPSLHASNFDRIVLSTVRRKDYRDLTSLLNGQLEISQTPNLVDLNSAAKKIKSARGVLVGGNLVTVVSHLGTPFFPDLKNKILFIEEIGERAYRVHRLLTQLSLSGKLKGLKGIVIGDFFKCTEPDGKDLTRKVIRDWAMEQVFPVFSGVPCGHGVNQMPLFMGVPARLIRQKSKVVMEIKNAFQNGNIL